MKIGGIRMKTEREKYKEMTRDLLDKDVVEGITSFKEYLEMTKQLKKDGIL